MNYSRIERFFPCLSKSGYSITSKATEGYNCLAWAANETDVWWWPDANEQYFWPLDVEREETVEAFIKAYGLLGYVICNNADYEDGYEKIAIYADRIGKPTHAARQLPSGEWTSKLGRLEDIRHNRLEGLCGEAYGSVKVILKRPK